MMTKRERRRREFKALAVEYVEQRGEGELSDIVRYIQKHTRFGVERNSLGNILRSESRLIRERYTHRGVYVTVYALAQAHP